MARTRKLGLIINPVAGMGGSVGLKGTDGELAAAAKALGAKPVAASRAHTALSQLASTCPDIEILTAPGAMGAQAVAATNFASRTVCDSNGVDTSAADTKAAARAIAAQRPDLLLFVGGDGTARDIHEIIEREVPVLGVPAGVKMHSAVFAATARAAGDVAARYLSAADPGSMLDNAEILDRLDTHACDAGRSPHLFGVVRSPRLGFLVPGAKASQAVADVPALAAAIDRVADMLRDDRVSLIGPGSTMQRMAARLGFDGSPLGVDAVRNGHLLGKDLAEQRILELIDGVAARIVLSVVGGQGFLFGRGNQQLSAQVIARVGVDNIIIVASLEKLAALPGKTLLVDTGDESLDDLLAGHLPVIVSATKTVIMPVKNASKELGD